jgi:hypothetical protein
MVSILTVCWMLSLTSCLETTEVLSARGFTHVPKNLSENLLTLDLSNNNITAIGKDDFRTLKQVKTINLSYNQIQTLHERSFEQAYCLQELDLSYNNIVHLPNSIFSNNHKLTKLYLKKNNLQVFGDFSKAHHILDSQSLIYLDISFCNITYISCESLKGLPKLQTLKTDGNNLTQQNVEMKIPPINLKTMKKVFCNSSTFEIFCCNLQEQGVKITSSNLSLSTQQVPAKEKDGIDPFVLQVGIILCVVIFFVVVTSYFLIIICKNRKANKVTIKRQNSVNAIQSRPLPRTPFEDGEYEEPIMPSNECISSATSSNLQLSRNFGYVRLPSAESDSRINADISTYHVSMEPNNDSTYSFSGSTESQDSLPNPSSIYIYSYADVNEQKVENNLPVPPMKGKFSISPSPHFSAANRPSTTGIPRRSRRSLRCSQDGGYLERKEAPGRPTPTFSASPTRNATTFCVTKFNSENAYKNVYISSVSIDFVQGS